MAVVRAGRLAALALGFVVSLGIAAPAAGAADERLFDVLAGAWSGVGSVTVASGPERIRCRAVYGSGGPDRLHLDLRCASDTFNLQVQSDLARAGDRVSGTWTEATLGVSGEVTGTVSGNAIQAVVQGLGVEARMSVVVHGNTQAVTLTSQSSIASNATITLRRG